MSRSHGGSLGKSSRPARGFKFTALTSWRSRARSKPRSVGVASAAIHSGRADLACIWWVDLVIVRNYMHDRSCLCTMSL